MASQPSHQDAPIKNWTLWSMLIAAERVIGKDKLADVLKQANLPQYIGNYPPENQAYGTGMQSHLARIEQALTDMYGARGANTILLGIGKEFAQNTVKEFLTGLVNIIISANSLLPKATSLRNSLGQTINGLNTRFDTKAKAVEENGMIYIDDPTCPHCLGRRADSAICTFQRGFLAAILERTKADMELVVEEVLCKAKGDASCRYRISIAGETQPKQTDIPKSI
jgi:predicted hydrocarbon binding protein